MAKGIKYLRQKLAVKRARVELRYGFYDMKNRTKDFNISTPPSLIGWTSCLGWCGSAVDSIADRLMFKRFKNDNFGLNEIFGMNNPDLLFDAACKGALISSCDFIYIRPDDDGYPQLEVIDGANATGELDPVTGFLKEGYAVLERDQDTGNPLVEAYFLPKRTEYYWIDPSGRSNSTIRERVYTHVANYPLLVPVIFRPDASRPFGHSRISRACMSLMGSAIRTIKRSEISAEFYSFPQKWVTGLSRNHQKMEKWKAAMSYMLAFEQDKNGEHPIVGQFQQQTMAPHMDQLKMFASLFAGETGLTMDDLGFPTANPSSAEAIKASHENLRKTAKKAQKTFGSAFLNAGILAASIRDEFPYRRTAFYESIPCWYPVFEPDLSALTLVGDGAQKINLAVPGFFDAEALADMTGIDPAEG